MAGLPAEAGAGHRRFAACGAFAAQDAEEALTEMTEDKVQIYININMYMYMYIDVY